MKTTRRARHRTKLSLDGRAKPLSSVRRDDLSSKNGPKVLEIVGALFEGLEFGRHFNSVSKEAGQGG
jgi:hypothetical protein